MIGSATALAHARRTIGAKPVTWLVAAALTLALFGLYRMSPQRKFLDSRFALLSSQALLDHRTLDIGSYLPGGGGKVSPPGQKTKGPYQLLKVKGRVLYRYPPGTAVLSAPFVAALRPAGLSPLDAKGRYDSGRERKLQGVLAAALAALTATLIFFAARRELPVGKAAVVALTAALGSGLWSAASRVMWSHTWSTLLIAAAWLALLSWEDGQKRHPHRWGAGLGLLLSALFWVRPTGALMAGAGALYVALRHRRAFAALAATGAVGLFGYWAVAQEFWHSPLGVVASQGTKLLGSRPRAFFIFFELLVAPGRGLIFYSPILIAVLWLLARHRVAPERRPLALLAAAVVLLYVLLYSRWGWGGTVGPRFLCDPTALLAWLGAHAWRCADARAAARQASRPALRARRALAWSLVAILMAASVTAHAGIALDNRELGRSQSAGEKRQGVRVPYFERDHWSWSSLPQRRMPQLIRFWMDEPRARR